MKIILKSYWQQIGIQIGVGTGNSLQYSCLENSMDRGSWRATVHVVAESDMTEHAHTQLHQSVSRSVVSNSFATQWTVAHQAPLSMGFSRQEYWRGLPFSPPGDLPDPGIKPTPALQGDSLLTEPSGNNNHTLQYLPKEAENQCPQRKKKKTHTCVFVSSLFIMAKTWTQPRCSSQVTVSINYTTPRQGNITQHQKEMSYQAMKEPCMHFTK